MKIEYYIGDFENYLKGLNQHKKTVKRKVFILRRFSSEALKGMDIRELREKNITYYIKQLRNKNYSDQTITQNLSFLRQFLTWLYKNDLILSPLANIIPSIKMTSKEKTIFSQKEIEIFLDSIGIKEIRIRLFFELLYSSGIRKLEALKIRWKDISTRNRKIRIDQGKGSRDRYVPYSKTVAMFLKKWKKVSYISSSDYLFPGKNNSHMGSTTVQRYFTKYLKESSITKKGLTIHSIRHSCATHLLESGADVRYVSELLGHNSMETTVKYTHPTVDSQRRAYKMYHPRENSYFNEVDKGYLLHLKELKSKLQIREEINLKKADS